MPKTKGVSAIGEKYSRVTPARSADYEQGVKNPRTDWAGAATNAAPNFASGVSAAIAAGSYGKGITKAGTGKWQAKAVSKGVPRFGPGVQEARPDYEAAITPYIQTIESTTLPPRGPKGDPRNYARVTAIGQALRNKKIKG